MSERESLCPFLRRLSQSRFDPDFLEWLGTRFGGDQREYLSCENCGGEYAVTERSPHYCWCGRELYIHVPDSELWVIRWRCWKHDQKWWPQRLYVSPADSDGWWQYWQWLGREWRRQPSKSPLFGAVGKDF